MTAGLGCGAVFLPFGQGRNDWLYNIPRPPYLLSLDSILLSLPMSKHLSDLRRESLRNACICSVLELETTPFLEGLKSFADTTYHIRNFNFMSGNLWTISQLRGLCDKIMFHWASYLRCLTPASFQYFQSRHCCKIER